MSRSSRNPDQNRNSSRSDKAVSGDVEEAVNESEVSPREAESESFQVSFSGPLPPPGVLKQYPEEVQKSIVDQAKSQTKHRQGIEKNIVDSNINNSRKAMNYAFWITLVMVSGGIFLLAMDRTTEGLITTFSTPLFHAGNYILQKYRELQEVKDTSEKENDERVREKQ